MAKKAKEFETYWEKTSVKNEKGKASQDPTDTQCQASQTNWCTTFLFYEGDVEKKIVVNLIISTTQ